LPGSDLLGGPLLHSTGEGTRTGTLTVTSTAPGSPHSVTLTGVGERSLVTHYYRSILRREPDSGGKTFWSGEATRVANLGANVNETWFAMAISFYFSAEYAAFNRSNTAFVTDLYVTFFNRAPDTAGETSGWPTSTRGCRARWRWRSSCSRPNSATSRRRYSARRPCAPRSTP
jgi:hypothetical protein